jgi:hypothetical protein
MRKFNVHYVKHTRYYVVIEAESLEEAIGIAEEGTHDDGLIEIDDSTSWEVSVDLSVAVLGGTNDEHTKFKEAMAEGKTVELLHEGKWINVRRSTYWLSKGFDSTYTYRIKSVKESK